MAETFTRSWRGWIRSSDGYAVRLTGRSRIDYVDQHGELHVASEAMSKPWYEIVVYVSSIPDSPQRSRADVLARLHRALSYAKFQLTDDDAGA